jgi:LacI family transcriptional regulator
MNAPEHSGSAVTLRDIAQRLGISHVTVSMALRDSPRIPEAHRKEIREMAAEMGYRPNPMAAALAHFKQSSKVRPVQAAMAWVNFWPDPKKLYSYAEFERYWQGAKASAEKIGYHLEEFVCDKSLTTSRLQKILVARGVNGILIPPHQVAVDWGDFAWERFFAVRFGRTVETPRVHLVTADQAANTILAFDEVCARGYKRIGFVSLPLQRAPQFEAGFLAAQRFVPLKLRLPVFRADHATAPTCHAAFATWLKKQKPDAIITETGCVPTLLKKAGCRVPEDIGVAVTSILDGNADSGIYQNPEEIGRVAVLMVASLIHNNDKGIPPIFRQNLVEGKWVDGSSLPRRQS